MTDPWTSLPVRVATRIGLSVTVKGSAVWYGRAPQDQQPPTITECVTWLTRSRPGYYREVVIRLQAMTKLKVELWEFREEQRGNVHVQHGDQIVVVEGGNLLDTIYGLVLAVP